MLLAENIYELAKHFSSDEKYGLFSQIKRALVSIPSTIAEGAARKVDYDLCHSHPLPWDSRSEMKYNLYFQID